ncbi:regulatory protein RecX [Nocardioides currus]|uniref:Regulatory protein RecX n=1 Tax=Nocardioides currus TaxID=2133958 RepID=A0A2R7YS15_9ACTN|nr:regulatory protein RecX [Nocardioides currus]PUA79161.1 RecX family transcriptional regulator [Nocardioides currus]
MTSDRGAGRSDRRSVTAEDRPAPAWLGDVHAGVDAWTRSSRLSKTGTDETEVDDEPFERVPTGRSRRSARSGRSGRSGRSRERGGASGERRTTRSTRTPPPPDTAAQGPDADPESVARKILLDALTGQARSRKELADRLAKKEVPQEIADRLLDRFEEVGLIDDEAFAKAWIESRQPGKGLARRALAQELRRKGIDDEVAREALDEIDPADEAASARALVRKKLRSVRGLDQQKATRRLVSMLARKGYGAGMAFAIVKEELSLDDEADLGAGLEDDL